MHAAKLRVLVALSGRSGTPVPGLESSVRGLYITLDFWPHACSAIVEILDTGGHYLFNKDFFPPSLKATEVVLTIRAPIGLFSLFPVWDLIQKAALEHLTLDWNNELDFRNCHIPRSVASFLLRFSC